MRSALDVSMGSKGRELWERKSTPRWLRAEIAPDDAGDPQSAHVPDDATPTPVHSLFSSPARNSASAMADRQMFPVHTNRTPTSARGGGGGGGLFNRLSALRFTRSYLPTMTDSWNKLVPRMQELKDLYSASALLAWDQAVMMPPKGAAARARTQATLDAITHSKLTDSQIGELVAELEAADGLDTDQKATVRVLRRDYDKATKVPEQLVRDLAEAHGKAYQAWTEARPADDFSLFEPHLKRVIDLKRQEADALGWEGERYDALVDNFEPGMTTAEIEKVFAGLVTGLKPILDAVLPHVGEEPGWVLRPYNPGRQIDFCNWLVDHLGYEMGAGRLDLSPHPFTMTVSSGDVRQTTRTEKQGLAGSVYAAIHETGHALYEQGIPEDMSDLPIGRAPSLGLHESQSRMWENQVGRSRAFTSFLLPRLKDRFGDELGMLSPDEFYRGVNHVRRSLIRVNADELTYNLHVAVRFELETALFRDELDVSDLPAAWNEKYEKLIGIRPPSAADGVLQDMHWSMGGIGYFPTYTLGNIYAAAFFAKAQQDLGDLDEEFRKGETARLLQWLRDNIHSQAYRYEAKELAEKVTGEPTTAGPLLEYLKNKYCTLYDVSI